MFHSQGSAPSLTTSKGTLSFRLTVFSFNSPNTPFGSEPPPFLPAPFLVASLFNSEQNPVIWLMISLPPNKFWAENVLFSFDLLLLLTEHSFESSVSSNNGFFSLLVPPSKFVAVKFGFLFSISSLKFLEQMGLLFSSQFLTIEEFSLIYTTEKTH